MPRKVERDEEVEVLRRRVQHLEDILARNGVKHQNSHAGGTSNKNVSADDQQRRHLMAAKELADHFSKERQSKLSSRGHRALLTSQSSTMTGVISEPSGEEKKDDNMLHGDQPRLAPTLEVEEIEVKTKKQPARKTKEFHPPGTQPGGTWYKQTYKPTPQSLSEFAYSCLCAGPSSSEAYLASQVAKDERFVYLDRNGSKQFYNVKGKMEAGVSSHGFTLSAVPAQIVKDRCQPDPVPAPPGLKDGGLWYRQLIHGGRHRMIYRPEPCGMDFYDKEGQRVNLFEGPVEPPVSMASLL